MRNTGLATFHEDVQLAEKPVIVDFWSPECPPCRRLLPILEGLSNEGIPVFKATIEDEPELAQHYGVSALPTLVLFKNGEAVDRLVGLTSKERILNFYNRAA
jgi:thioredoxin 1